jgi:hypothetical protein
MTCNNITFRVYDKYISESTEEETFLYNCVEGLVNNLAHEEFFNSLISGLKKKNHSDFLLV